MTNLVKSREERVESREGIRGVSFVIRHSSFVTPLLLTITLLTLYITTLARGLILGDPTEYTYAAHLLGIAHPPGYAVMILLGKLFQTVIPIGTIAFRSHLLSAMVGVTAALAIYGVTRQTIKVLTGQQNNFIPFIIALTAGVGANQWQHSIHTNPHIITATFFIINIYLLLRWQDALEKGERIKHNGENSSLVIHHSSLYMFCLSTGIGLVHHPLTVFGFPAYTLFILLVYPAILRDWRTLLKMIGWAALGLSLFIYYPLVSATEPLVGPHTMNTIEGFLDHVLARGLAESLPYYTLAEQPLRQVVFWSIMRLQFTLPIVLLALVGVGRLITGLFKSDERPTSLLLLGTFGVVYGFVISLKQQDIMAYLLGPLMLIAIFAGVGAYVTLHFATHFIGKQALLWGSGRSPDRVAAARSGDRPQLMREGYIESDQLTNSSRWISVGLLFCLLLAGSFLPLIRNYRFISLRNFDEGDRHVEAVFSYFEDEPIPVVLLNDWEFMTPIWYTGWVEGREADPTQVRPEFVSAAEPWLPSVFNYLPGGPVYINSYRREIVEAGFRLRPAGPFYQVVEPGDQTLPTAIVPVNAGGDGIELVGFQLPEQPVTAGEFVPLTLAMRVPAETADFFAPVVTVGEIELPFTTDTHLITPLWQAEEIIVERFDFALPHAAAGGTYPVTVRIKNLSQNRDSGIAAEIGTLTVIKNSGHPTGKYLANFRQRVGLVSATVQGPGLLMRRTAPYEQPLTAQTGDVLNLFLQWEAIDHAEESYTVFVHLIDQSNRSYTELDYTPLGGATPTHLWFPKWLPGQTLLDPYRMVIPADLPPGAYAIEVGLYEMRSGRRLHMHDERGNLVGDRYILGPIKIEE